MVVAFIIGLGLYNVFYGSNGLHGGSIALSPDPPTPKTVKFTQTEAQDVRGLVRQFIFTAVAHKHLAESYRLLGPGPLRQNITLKQWAGGMTTVGPYPVDGKTTIVFEKPEYSYARRVRLQVHVVTPDRPNQTMEAGTDTFFVDAEKVDGRWLMSSWVPRWTPPIPNAS
jgi:hypothetical protein